MSNPKVLEIIRSTRVPSLPDVLSKILMIANDPKTSSSDLEKLVIKEPGLVTQILKMINSAYYALPKRVASVRYAMSMLGFSTVKSIATGLALIDSFNHLDDLNKEYVYLVWRSSLISANMTLIFTAKEPQETKDRLYLAGMVKDVGHLLLSQHYQSKYQPLIEEYTFPPMAVEKELFDTDHIEVGCALLDEWRFSEDVICSVRDHHAFNTLSSMESRLSRIMYLCDLIGIYSFNINELFNTSWDDLSDEMRDALDVADCRWDKLCAQKTRFIEMADMIDQLLHIGNV